MTMELFNCRRSGSEHETILSVVQEGSESNIVPVHNHHLTRLLEPKRLLASSPEASRRAGSPPPGISFQQTTPVDTAPPQSALLKTFHILVNRGQEWIRFLTLIPAFGSNGQLLSKEFDAKDISELSFLANGMHPKSYFNTICDLIIIIQFIVVVWFVPFLVAYQEDDGIRHLVSGVLSILFAVNTAISGVTPISKVSNTIICTVAEYEEQRPSLSTWIKEWIIKKETWLAILTTIPFDVIFSSLPHSKLLLLIRLLGVFKMAEAGSRCALWQCMNQCLDKAAGMPISNIFSIAYGMIIFIHINACEMYYLGTLSGFVGWETAFFHIHDASTFDFYAWTFLQSVSHMFPNSFIPQTATEQLMGSVFNVFGAVLYASFIGAISNAVMSVNPAGRLYSQKMEQLNDYVKWKNLATDTEKKLFKFYETKYRGKYFDEDLLLTEMNESLRAVKSNPGPLFGLYNIG
ncbi:hypothetical protein BC830DRAFT_902696 [Chytriomyces sp. MP71]|nr:hypothetical protein BC830DRAFT_902696 [Chytriomyces sp. MP71]